MIVNKGAVSLFAEFFGGVDFDIGSSAFAKVEFVVSPVDLVISIDASGSMQGNPIAQAQIASKNFATSILGTTIRTNSPSQVGYAPYRYCYEDDDDDPCVQSMDLPPSNADCNNPGDSWVLCLGRDLDLIHEKIDATWPANATNVCMGVYASGEILDGPGNRNNDPAVAQFIVILTDGANVWNDHPSVPDECWPSKPTTLVLRQQHSVAARAPAVADAVSDWSVELDICTYDVGAGPVGRRRRLRDLRGRPECGMPRRRPNPGDNGSLPTNAFCNGIGNNDPDNVADRRLLKCIASSTAGTNDHYFETDDANDLPSIFQGIAYEIATRGLTGAPVEPARARRPVIFGAD